VTDRKLLQFLGTKIRESRTHAGLTQECLGELVGVHWKTIGCIERGIYPFSVTTFIRICQHLEVSPNRLIDGLPEPDAKRAHRIKKALVRKRRNPLTSAD